MKKQGQTPQDEEKKDLHDECRKERESWRAKYLRALADYQNLEKRVDQRRNDDVQYAGKHLVLKLLPAIDVLEIAQRHLKDQGLGLALKQFADILTSEQVERIEVVGKTFDPKSMECVELVGEKPKDIVTEEIAAGYTMYGKIIRVARVKVGMGENEQQKKEEKEA